MHFYWKYGLIEVKLGASKIKEAREHLINLKNKIIEAKSKNKNLKEPDFLMIITGSNTCMKTDDGIYIVPIDCLKNWAYYIFYITIAVVNKKIYNKNMSVMYEKIKI